MWESLKGVPVVLSKSFNLIAGVNGDGDADRFSAVIVGSMFLLPMVIYFLWPILVGRAYRTHVPQMRSWEAHGDGG